MMDATAKLAAATAMSTPRAVEGVAAQAGSLAA
jgi:hypothetical protein